ncbi:hypothetical protein OIU84_002951 [Salix udensis]|uniref:Uncharacterized protein n=1 Tax=Salix udensis TaxID=889485 RepID=A0AAD6P598_9ROSI|nr:hypothetical protein OIU84_002951 [Salix udensis]
MRVKLSKGTLLGCMGVAVGVELQLTLSFTPFLNDFFYPARDMRSALLIESFELSLYQFKLCFEGLDGVPLVCGCPSISNDGHELLSIGLEVKEFEWECIRWWLLVRVVKVALWSEAVLGEKTVLTPGHVV